jgi:hypothetical protein
MAGRRYVRDNRGRFATVGATARGGRLATASGNKRATQAGRIEGAVPSGTIRPGRRSAKPEAVAPATRLTPRQKAKRLGGRPERMNEGPKVLASNPKGTVGASGPVRNMNRAARQIKGVAPAHSAQMVSLDVFSNRGMSAGNAGTQVRRNAFRDPGQRISRVNARAVWRDPSGSTYAKAARQELLQARRAHSPRKRK